MLKIRLRPPTYKCDCYDCPGARIWQCPIVVYRPWTPPHDYKEPQGLLIRWVEPYLVNMSERSMDMLRYIGADRSPPDKIGWVEDDAR